MLTVAKSAIFFAYPVRTACNYVHTCMCTRAWVMGYAWAPRGRGRAIMRTTVLISHSAEGLHYSAYLSTVPNLAGQYRFLLQCPAVPPSTSVVLNSFDVAKFVRLFASTLVYGGHDRKKGVARSCACILS